MTDLEPPEQFLIILTSIFDSGAFTLSVILFLFLLLCSALISASEIAFFSITPQDLDSLKKDKSPRALMVLDWKDKPKELLSIILIVNNFVNVGIVILGAYLTDVL